MTAFDTAWSLMKMPVVEGSYSKEGKWPSASFEDPITGEILPMHIRAAEGDGSTYILNQGGDKRLNERGSPAPDDIRSVAHFGQESDNRFERTYDEDGKENRIEDWKVLPPYYTSGDTRTVDEWQRRGYATALYDFASRYFSEDDTLSNPDGDNASRIIHDSVLEDDGDKFWENAEKTGKANKNYEWRVRDDI